MNCGICRATDLAKFKDPAKTRLYREGALTATDYSGPVGPGMAVQILALRHNRTGHMVKADLSIQTLNKQTFDAVAKTKRFWFPTDETSGPGPGSTCRRSQ